MRDRSHSTAASSPLLSETCSAEVPGGSEPDDCSAELQVDDRYAEQASPADCWGPVAALDDCSELAAALGDYSDVVDSSADYFQRADYSELVAVQADHSAVLPQNDHSAPAAQLDD